MLTCNMYIALTVPAQPHNLICDIWSHLPTRDSCDSIFQSHFYIFGLLVPHVPLLGPKSASCCQLSVEVRMNQSEDGRGGGKMDSLDVKNL